MNKIKKALLLMMACVACVTAWAQIPIVKKYTFSDRSFLTRMSDNGKWAVTGAGSADVTCEPKLVNLTSGTSTNIGSATNNEITNDVSNDGDIVVGQCQGLPAYWSKSDGLWHSLELKSSHPKQQVASKFTDGVASAVTPDGKFAVGYVSAGSEYSFAPALWNLATGKVVETPNLPLKDMAHIDQKQMRFDEISADGRYIVATMSASYLPSSSGGDDEASLGGLFSFVYDTQTQSYKVIGFKESDTKRWTSDYDGCFVVDGVHMSNNGKWVTGACRIWRATDETTDYYVPYLYDVANDKFTVYENESTRANAAYVVSNDGYPLMSSPEGSPYRNWYIFDGARFWYSVQDVLSQRWGVDLMGMNSLDNTGTVDCISDDGKRVIATPTYSDGDSYVLDLPVTVSAAINEKVSMLGSYTATPAEGSEISAIASMQVTFTQNIKTVATGNVVTLEDEDDNVVATATKNLADGKVLDITFRRSKAKLEEGKTYYVHIPANTIAMTEAEDKKNDDIYIELKGRKDAPVAATKIVPNDGMSVAKVDANTNPITLTFDTKVTIDSKETRKALMYRNDETEPYAELNFYYNPSVNYVYLAPATTLNLYKENNYRVVVPAGIITDVAGNGGNEEISFTYHGAYERTVSYNDANLFKNDFDSRDIVNAFMLFDGDQKTPAAKPKEWNFNYSLPWYFVKSSASTSDYAAASHSMYSPAGKSDDWMVIPQLFVPDAVCDLEFQAQSYLFGKNDHLKVYVWECDNVYNNLTKDIVAKIKAEGDLVFDEQLSPGTSEETLEGDWKDYKVDLKKYAGKNVYIAFYNDNEDQSAIFLDNVYVKHNMPVLISFDNEESVINKESVKVSGSIAGNLEDKTISEVKLTLKDAQNNVVDTKTLSGLQLKKGTYTKFEFDKSLPLNVGVANKFNVVLDVEGEQTQVSKTINNLVFQPIKRVVLEENTGRDCSNCPLGIVTIDNLKKRFGDKFLPIAIHGYTGDPLGEGLDNYFGYLGLSAAPSAVINRSDSIMSPMVSDGNGGYYMSKAALEAATGYTCNDLWSDYVEEEVVKPALSEVSASISYDEASRTISVPATVRYAMNAEAQNINLFAVLIEQEVPAIYQVNGFASLASDVLLPWSQGGAYASPYVTGFNYDDVCRGTWGTTYLGTGGLLPSNIVAGEEYKVNDIKFVLADNSDINPKNCQAIVMMFDANTGKYINAVRTSTIGETTGIAPVVVKGNAADANVWYTLSGMKMMQKPTQAGIYIHNGKKVVVK